MRNLLLVILLTVTSLSYTQEEKKDIDLSYYLSAGISMSNNTTSTFSNTSFPSLEFGVMSENISFGLVGGLNSLNGGGSWSELKTAVYFPVKSVQGYALFGYGTFIEGFGTFIEYGGGFLYAPKTFGGFIQVSNWAGTWYLTPGVIINF